MRDNLLIEDIHNRLQRIEEKLDDLSEWKHYLTGQAKVISLVISIVVSISSFLLQRYLK